MAFRIVYTTDADLNLSFASKRDEAMIRASTQRCLSHEPAAPSLQRKPLAPNSLGARWELRLGEWRVYYDIDAVTQQERVIPVGLKVRERAFPRGVATDMRN